MAILPPDPVYMMKGDMGPVHSLLFRISPYVEHLYAGTESGRVHIWDLKKNRQLLKLNTFNEPCLALQNVGDEYLITQRKSGTINLWKAQGSDWIVNDTIKTDYSGFCRFQMSTEDTLFVPMNDSKFGLFSLKTLKTEIEFNPHKLREINSLGTVMAMKPCVDKSTYVLVIYDGGRMLLWDVRSYKIVSSLKTELSPMCIDFNSSVMHGVVGSPSDFLQVFSMSSDQELSGKIKLPIKNPGISVVAFRPDTKVFATGGWDSRIRIFSWKTLRPLVILDQHRASIHDLIFSECRVESYDSKCLMAAASKDGNVSLWNLYN